MPAKRIHVVELMSQSGFPLPQQMYGQTILKLDLIRQLHHVGEVPVVWHLLGKHIASGPIGQQAQGIHINMSADWPPDAYNAAIEQLCKQGDPVVVVSSFAHQEQQHIIQVGLLRKRYPNLRLVVVLHCPLTELIRQPRNGSPAEQTAAFLAHNRNSLDWLQLLAQDADHQLIDRWVAVSSTVKESFEQPLPFLGRSLPSPHTIRVITNGVDDSLYAIPDARFILQARKQLGINSGFVIGVTGGHRQQKGHLIQEHIIRHYAQSPRTAPDFLFSVLPGYAGLQLLEALTTPALKSLLGAKRIHLCFDISKWQGFGDQQKIKAHFEHMFQQHLQALEPGAALSIKAAWKGVLTYPVQQLLDVYLRPSLDEAFGRGAVEAALCGNAVLASDRGFLPTIIPPRNVIHLPRALTLHHRDAELTDQFKAGSVVAAERFIARIEQLRSSRYASTPQENRLACTRVVPPLATMVRKWERLIGELASQESRHNV